MPNTALQHYEVYVTVTVIKLSHQSSTLMEYWNNNISTKSNSSAFKSKDVDWKFNTELKVSKFGLVLIILLAVIDDAIYYFKYY
jgi:hypothetical protein